MFQNKVIVITGGANGIGKCIAEEFQKNGAHVCVIDQSEGDHYVRDAAMRNAPRSAKRSSRPWKTASAARSLWWPPLRHLFRKHPGPNSAPTAARLMRAASSARTVEVSCKLRYRIM